MSIPTSEEVMMVADYSPGDHKMSENKENKNVDADAPLSDESNIRMSTDFKKEDVKTIRLSENGKTEDRLRDSDSEGNQESKQMKRKHRRRRGGKNHRKWKPYDKMSWREKQVLDEKETKRATQKREDAFLSGHPVAPYNTTQFLMEDHEAISPDLHRNNSKDSNVSTDTSSDFYEEDDNDGFQHKNFLDTFNDIRQQELMNRSKEELVRDYVELEMKLELVEQTRKRNSRRRSRSSSDESCSLSSEGESGRERDLDISEYLRLKAENEALKGQNTELRNKLNTLHSESKQ